MIIGKKAIVPGSNFYDIRANEVALTLTSIAVTHAPTKTVYYITDDFEPTGMEITATFAMQGGGVYNKIVRDYIYSPRSFDTAGEQNVTISYTYKGVTATTTQAVIVSQATSYQISEELENGSISGDTQIVEGETANVTIIALEGAVLPQVKEVITVTGATVDSYNNTTGAMVLSNPTDGVVISGRCPDEDTWMDTVALGGKTYRQIFGTPSAKLLKFDGMVDYAYDSTIMEVYASSGPGTGLVTDSTNSDTLCRALEINCGSDTRSAWRINQSFPSAGWPANHTFLHIAKVKGGMSDPSTRPTESSSYTKLIGVNQSSTWTFGTGNLIDIADANESEFATWTTRSNMFVSSTAMTNGANAYYGVPGTGSHGSGGTWYVDDVFFLDLTAIFGAGNEPTEQQMTELYEQFVYLWKYHNEADAPTPPTPPTPTSYTITSNVADGTLSGDTEINPGETANVTIVPTGTNTLPKTAEMVTVTGATMDSYNASTGAITLSNATGNVTVAAKCPDPDTWMDTVALGGKTYREIFANQTAGASGPKLMMYDGMVNIDTTKCGPYTTTGLTSYYVGTEHADTLGRSILLDNSPDGTRACFIINKPDASGAAIWSTGKWAAGDSIFLAAKIKGGITGGTRPETGNFTKIGVNQGSSGQSAGVIYIADLSDPNESEFADWTVRTCLAQTTVASNSGNAYFGVPSLSASSCTVRYYVDDVFIINVTKIFGTGNEPTQAQLTECYENFVAAWKSHNVYNAS